MTLAVARTLGPTLTRTPGRYGEWVTRAGRREMLLSANARLAKTFAVRFAEPKPDSENLR
eukprot:1667739-Rhodomonas_salina.1